MNFAAVLTYYAIRILCSTARATACVRLVLPSLTRMLLA
jgi:hypothetical protein